MRRRVTILYGVVASAGVLAIVAPNFARTSTRACPPELSHLDCRQLQREQSRRALREIEAESDAMIAAMPKPVGYVHQENYVAGRALCADKEMVHIVDLYVQASGNYETAANALESCMQYPEKNGNAVKALKEQTFEVLKKIDYEKLIAGMSEPQSRQKAHDLAKYLESLDLAFRSMHKLAWLNSVILLKSELLNVVTTVELPNKKETKLDRISNLASRLSGASAYYRDPNFEAKQNDLKQSRLDISSTLARCIAFPYIEQADVVSYRNLNTCVLKKFNPPAKPAEMVRVGDPNPYGDWVKSHEALVRVATSITMQYPCKILDMKDFSPETQAFTKAYLKKYYTHRNLKQMLLTVNKTCEQSGQSN